MFCLLTYLYRFELEHHHDRCPDLLLQTVHFETIALKDHFGPRGMRNTLEDRLHLRRIERS
jgi:hypothetical protein